MKTILVCVFILLAVARAQVSMEQVWNISDPTLFADSLSYNLIYTVSDFITSDKVSFSVWNEDCQEGEVPADPFLTGELMLPLLDDPELDGSGTRSINIKVVADAQTIASAPGGIYSENNGPATASVTFCVRVGTTTPQPNAIEVNFLETIVDVEYDLTDGFDILSISQRKKEKKEKKVKEDFRPEGNWCDLDGNVVTKEEAKLRGYGKKGSQLIVCVRVNEKAKKNGLVVFRVDNFTWVREDPETGGVVEQPAVVNGKAPQNGLTTLECKKDKGCSFNSILTAQFFAENIIPPTEAPTQAPTGGVTAEEFVAPPLVGETPPPIESMPPTAEEFVAPPLVGETPPPIESMPPTAEEVDFFPIESMPPTAEEVEFFPIESMPPSAEEDQSWPLAPGARRGLEKTDSSAGKPRLNPSRKLSPSAEESHKSYREPDYITISNSGAPRKLEAIQGFAGYGSATVGFPRRRGLRGEQEFLEMQVPFRVLQELQEGISGDISLTLELDPNPLTESGSATAARWWLIITGMTVTLAFFC